MMGIGVPVLLLSCQPQPAPEAPPAVEYLRSDATRSAGLPFSDAVRVGHMLYVSGQVGNIPGTLDLAPGGIGAETRQALENIQRILERHGSRGASPTSPWGASTLRRARRGPSSPEQIAKLRTPGLAG